MRRRSSKKEEGMANSSMVDSCVWNGVEIGPHVQCGCGMWFEYKAWKLEHRKPSLVDELKALNAGLGIA